MDAKRAAKKSAPKKADNTNAAEMDAISQLQRAEAEVFALQQLLEGRSHEANTARQAEKLLRERLGGITEKLEHQRLTTHDITADITRQYKVMQEQMMQRIEELEGKCAALCTQLANKDVLIQQLRAEREQMELEKDRQIREQRKRMDDMAQEFADMLKETLEKMTDRIANEAGSFHRS